MLPGSLGNFVTAASPGPGLILQIMPREMRSTLLVRGVTDQTRALFDQEPGAAMSNAFITSADIDQ